MCTPGAEKKIRGRNLQGKVVSAPSGRERNEIIEDILLADEIWRAGVVNVAVSACVLRATTKKSNFSRKKCTPRENPGYPYAV